MTSPAGSGAVASDTASEDLPPAVGPRIKMARGAGGGIAASYLAVRP